MLLLAMGVMVAGIVFGIFGMAALGYGRKTDRPRAMMIGAVLILFPYFIANIWLIWAIGIALLVTMFVWRED